MKQKRAFQIIGIIGYIILMGALVYSAAKISATSAFFVLGYGLLCSSFYFISD